MLLILEVLIQPRSDIVNNMAAHLVIFLQASGNQIVCGLTGNDQLYNSYSTDSQVLLGGTGNDAYHIQSSGVTIVYEAPGHGNDTLHLDRNYLFWKYLCG